MKRGLITALALSALALTVTLTACYKGGPYNYGSASFVDDQNGWVTGWDATKSRSVLSRTRDGGATWTRVGSRAVEAHIVGWATFSTPMTGVWCVGRTALLYTTTGGRPWKAATVRGMTGDWFFSAASFASARVGWAAGVRRDAPGGAVAKTKNGGATWRVQLRFRARGSGGFLDIACPSTHMCYALKHGYRDSVWATSDGGVTWARHNLPGSTAKLDYDAIDFAGELVGWAVGAEGMIAKTADGGMTWTRQVSGVTERLRAVCFTSLDVGFAVGAGGVILKTQDGGATWTPQVSGTTLELGSVDFVSGDEGWAVAKAGWAPGQGEVLLHTTDGGVTWQ